MSLRQRKIARIPAEAGRGPNAIRVQSGSGFGTLRAACVRVGGRLRKGLVPVLAAVLILAAIAGCDRLSRHKVMTIFFTGVPSLEEQDRIRAALPALQHRYIQCEQIATDVVERRVSIKREKPAK